MTNTRTATLPDLRPLDAALVPKEAVETTVSTEDSAVRLAVRDFAPHTLALIPFSLAIGAASALNGVPLPSMVFAAIFLLAGTAQLAATELIGSDTGVVVVIATIVLINARFMIYGAGLARWFSAAPLRQKLALAIPLVDQSFLNSEERFVTMTELADRRRYYITGSLMLIGTFLSSQIVGYLIGPNVPPGLGLHLAAPLAFAGMLANSIKSRPHLTAAASAAAAMVLFAGVPGGLSLPIAIIVGLFAGNHAKGADSQ